MSRRVLVTGSRDWTDEHLIYIELTRWSHDDDVTVVHGDCPTGADAMADKWCELTGYPAERHPADWDRYGKRAGFIRNDEMVQLGADVCLAFIKNESKGATMTADLADAAGIPVLRYLA